jgi:hypothetical protein
MALLPPQEDRKPLVQFVCILTIIYIGASSFLASLPLALYWAWVIAGVAFLVQARVEPGLPRTLSGNIRRVMRAHVWPWYLIKR